MRIIIGVLAIVACLFLMQAAARVGFSRVLSRYAVMANSVAAADQAVSLSPSDPDARRAQATVLIRLQRPAEAVKSLEAATSLRYRDDYLWLELGNAREAVGDTAGALAAFDQAVRWAPYYAHTHWQRGNLLLRMGRTAEAFSELRRAADFNKAYLPNLIDLAFGMSNGVATTAEELIQIRDDSERLAFMRFLETKGKFGDAYRIWSRLEPARSRQHGIVNGGFEEQLLLNNSGFGGWILSAEKNSNKLAMDVSEKFGGTRSLQMNFNGNWTPGTPLLSQTIVVEPSKTYRVSFSVKTKDLVTGGPPMLMVNDAANDYLLGRSENFPSTASWQTLRFEFTTLATSEAAVIRLQRNSCDPTPCPIFGVLWLDEISIDSN